jgi:hypothetical protein
LGSATRQRLRIGFGDFERCMAWLLIDRFYERGDEDAGE